MRAYQVQTPDGLEDIKLVELAEPEIAADEILVKMKACSLNFRDLLIPQGGYARNDIRPIIPVSDGAGEVVAVGGSVATHKVGDRVVGNFFQEWIEGPMGMAGLHSALGGSINGVLADYFVLKANAALPIPEQLSYEEAATLPCAAVTAWHALVSIGNLKAGETVLLLGTGGVSIFGLQLAKALGANVIITSSSDEKLEVTRSMGADHTINYREHPDWENEVLKITDGNGVDNVLEVGGVGTFEKSIASAKVNGTVSMIGLLTGFDGPAFNLSVIFNLLHIHGIYVGSVEMFKAMNKIIFDHKIQPVIDKTFAFSDALDAYRHLAAAKHFGKVVIVNDN
jgi:NADPH:quinone reductase-like Zn-dependent oxidoreductase